VKLHVGTVGSAGRLDVAGRYRYRYRYGDDTGDMVNGLVRDCELLVLVLVLVELLRTQQKTNKRSSFRIFETMTPPRKKILACRL
jgi:hypothetical protein